MKKLLNFTVLSVLIILSSCASDDLTETKEEVNYSYQKQSINSITIQSSSISNYQDDNNLIESLERLSGLGFEVDTLQVSKFNYEEYSSYNFYVKNNREGTLNTIISGYSSDAHLNDILITLDRQRLQSNGNEIISILLYSDGNCYALIKSADFVNDEGQTIAGEYYFEISDCPEFVEQAPRSLEDLNPNTNGGGSGNTYGTNQNPIYSTPSYGNGYPQFGAFSTIEISGPNSSGYYPGSGGNYYYTPGIDPGISFPTTPTPCNNGIAINFLTSDDFFKINYLSKPANESIKQWWENPSNDLAISKIEAFLNVNGFDEENSVFNSEIMSFTEELLNVISNDSNLDINALDFILLAKQEDLMDKEFTESFLTSADSFMDLDYASGYNSAEWLTLEFSIKVAVLKAVHPEWSLMKVYWEASKGFCSSIIRCFWFSTGSR